MNEHIYTNIVFAPHFDIGIIGILGVFTLALLAVSYTRNGLRPLWRVPFLAVLFLALFNPSLQEEERTPLDSTVLVMVDESQSQRIDDRENQTGKALTWIEERLREFKNINLEIVKIGKEGLSRKTDLFSAYQDALKNIPTNQLAASFWITDGQIHDLPDKLADYVSASPIHAIITGNKAEKDRVLRVLEATSYGIVGQTVTALLRVDDYGTKTNTPDRPVSITINTGNEETTQFALPGEDIVVEFPIEHAGQNVFTVTTPYLDDEISEQNNRQAIVVNGVRDQLKVLLVSGRPHHGGRMWRNILTSDPSVELVHFTILRDPTKIDATPESELALIAFPIRELFEIKLYDFDLVIFDRFSRTNILPPQYFNNIAKYVAQGGAFLEVSGPGYASGLSIQNTSLKNILPGGLAEKLIEETFTPAVNDFGRLHPITQFLDKNTDLWAPWYRQIKLPAQRGETILTGIDDNPLLIIDRVGEGRVAQFTSDQIWLWEKGLQDIGGPYTQLLRRTIHWLMKEPDLEENALTLSEINGNILIQKRLFETAEEIITVTYPDGSEEEIVLSGERGNIASYTLKPHGLGVYSFKTTESQKYMLIGDVNPPEILDVISTDKKVATLISQTGGKAKRWQDMQNDAVRKTRSDSRMYGLNWLGIKSDSAYEVTSQRQTPLLPDFIYAFLMLGFLALAWWRESALK